jgi:hypothetical protein
LAENRVSEKIFDLLSIYQNAMQFFSVIPAKAGMTDTWRSLHTALSKSEVSEKGLTDRFMQIQIAAVVIPE